MKWHGKGCGCGINVRDASCCFFLSACVLAEALRRGRSSTHAMCEVCVVDGARHKVWVLCDRRAIASGQSESLRHTAFTFSNHVRVSVFGGISCAFVDNVYLFALPDT